MKTNSLEYWFMYLTVNLGLVFILNFFTLFLWNNYASPIFNLPILTYWQCYWLYILTRLIVTHGSIPKE